MAVVYFVYRSTKDRAALKVRLQLDKRKAQLEESEKTSQSKRKEVQFEASTQIHTSKNYWNVVRKKQRGLTGDEKNEKNDINKKLDELQDYILKEYENHLPLLVDKIWFRETVAKYYAPKENKDTQSELITDSIQSIIDEAETRKNAKGGIGLSKSRINAYISLKNIITEYQKSNAFKVKDVNVKFAKDFLKYLLNTKYYQKSYALKKIADLKTVCNDAELNGIETNVQFKKISSAKLKNDNILYLNPQELEAITNIALPTKALENARKWLLLGCNIGQRGSDLLNIGESNFITRNGFEVIELKQQKTDKNVTIPVLDTTKEIIKNGLPYKIVIQKFNDYIKEVCRLAELTETIQGSKVLMVDKNNNVIPKDSKGNYTSIGVKRKIAGTYQKWELISSHVCRRSFCTNLYGILPTPLIMSITAHSSEQMLLNYIGKDSLDYAQQIADFYTLQAIKEKKEPQLTVIKNAANK